MQADDDGRNHHTEANEPKDYPAASQPVEGSDREPQGEPQAAHAKNEAPATMNKPFWRTREGVGLIFDGIMMVVGVVGIVFLVRQVGQTEAALKQGAASLAEAKEANRLTLLAQQKADADSKAQDTRNERLVTASETSVKAAQDTARGIQAQRNVAAASLDQQRLSLELSQRAWLVASVGQRDAEGRVTKPGSEIDPPVPGQFVTGRIHVDNVGNSPAFDAVTRTYLLVRAIRVADITAIPLPERWDVSDMVRIGASDGEELEFRSPNVIAPGNAAVISNAASMTRYQPGALAFLFAKMTYVDVFGKTRNTYVCKIDVGNFLATCPRWNSVD